MRLHALYFELFVSIGFFEKSAKPTEKIVYSRGGCTWFCLLGLFSVCRANALSMADWSSHNVHV